MVLVDRKLPDSDSPLITSQSSGSDQVQIHFCFTHYTPGAQESCSVRSKFLILLSVVAAVKVAVSTQLKATASCQLP